MRRNLEYLIYALIIFAAIVRYANVGDTKDDGRRGRSVIPRPQVATPQAPPVQIGENADLPRDIAPQVTVEIDRKSGNAVGTAFAVDPRGLFVTARHVTEGCDKVYLVGRDKRLIPVKNLQALRNADFTVLNVPQLKGRSFAVSEQPPTRGMDGYMSGYPQGKIGDVRATVIGRTTMRSTGRYRSREHVVAWVERGRRPNFSGALGGISGGPAFDEKGFVVGTVVAGAPRRGRIYTTHPQVFEFLRLDASDVSHVYPTYNTDNYDQIGQRLRSNLSISQVYCKA